MATNPPPEGIADDFFEQIFAYGGGAATAGAGAGDGHVPPGADAGGGGGGGFITGAGVFPHNLLGLSLEQTGAGFVKVEEGSGSGKRFRDDAVEGAADGKMMTSSSSAASKAELASLFPAFGHVQAHPIHPNPPPQHFHGQLTPGSVAVVQHPPAPRPRVRARRGQATDPHSIAERLRRERIAERMRALQELVPNSNKTDRAAMLDEIVDYVKFLRLQVKVLSVSRLGGAGAVAQLVADIPLSSVEGVANDNQQVWEKWSMDGTELQVAKLMEEDVGAAMQFLQSKALCIMPISLAATIYHTPQQPEASSLTKPEPDTPS